MGVSRIADLTGEVTYGSPVAVGQSLPSSSPHRGERLERIKNQLLLLESNYRKKTLRERLTRKDRNGDR